jgi:hypothetical protein
MIDLFSLSDQMYDMLRMSLMTILLVPRIHDEVKSILSQARGSKREMREHEP